MISELRPIARDRPVGRYAPSPTGDLHPGNLRTALIAWEDCRRRGGGFILRIEDIDLPRNVAGSESRMIEDLRWLGIDWDEGPDVGGPAGPYRQSERFDIYESELERLAREGLVYACRCSRKDLREASAPHGPDGVIYPGTCRPADPTPLALAGVKEASIRFRLPDEPPVIEFADARIGPQRFGLRELSGDFVLKRRDGLWAYQFACAVDDALMGVTHVVRGEDLLSSAPRQIALIRALGWTPPTYEHIPLVIDESGKRMSKRDGSISLRTIRESSESPQEVRGRILRM